MGLAALASLRGGGGCLGRGCSSPGCSSSGWPLARHAWCSELGPAPPRTPPNPPSSTRLPCALRPRQTVGGWGTLCPAQSNPLGRAHAAAEQPSPVWAWPRRLPPGHPCRPERAGLAPPTPVPPAPCRALHAAHCFEELHESQLEGAAGNMVLEGMTGSVVKVGCAVRAVDRGPCMLCMTAAGCPEAALAAELPHARVRPPPPAGAAQQAPQLPSCCRLRSGEATWRRGAPSRAGEAGPGQHRGHLLHPCPRAQSVHLPCQFVPSSSTPGSLLDEFGVVDTRLVQPRPAQPHCAPRACALAARAATHHLCPGCCRVAVAGLRHPKYNVRPLDAGISAGTCCWLAGRVGSGSRHGVGWRHQQYWAQVQSSSWFFLVQCNATQCRTLDPPPSMTSRSFC